MAIFCLANLRRIRVVYWLTAVVITLCFWSRFTTRIPLPTLLPFPDSNSETLDLKRLISKLYGPNIQNVTASFVLGDVQYDLHNPQRYWKESLGKRLCILDIDTRPMNGPNQVWARGIFNWTGVKGPTPGFVNHYLYAKVHGYRYQFIHTTEYPDRVAAWTRIPAIVSALQECQVVVYMDSDAIFPHLHVPMEWLLNYWSITEDIAIAMSQEPVDWLQNHWNITRGELATIYSEPLLSWVSGLDSRGRTALNAGFMVVQNTPQTHELLYQWANCPTNTKYPGCDVLTNDWPAEQGAFNEYIRYDFPHRIREISCNEAHGYPNISIGCYGTLIRHYTLDKERVRSAVDEAALAQGVMERAQRSMVQDQANLYIDLTSTDFNRM